MLTTAFRLVGASSPLSYPCSVVAMATKITRLYEDHTILRSSALEVHLESQDPGIATKITTSGWGLGRVQCVLRLSWIFC